MASEKSFKGKGGFHKKKGGRQVLRSAAGATPVAVNDTGKVSKPKKQKKTLASLVHEESSATTQDTTGSEMNAYGALMVLLNSDKKKTKKPTLTKPKPQADDDDQEDSDMEGIEQQEGAVEGFVSEDEDPEAEMEQEEAEDVPTEENADDDSDSDNDETATTSSNPFIWHFQAVDPQVLEALPASSTELEWANARYSCDASLGPASLIATPKLTTALKTPTAEAASLLGTATIKEKLREPFRTANPEVTNLQTEFSKPLLNYQDILFPSRTIDNEKELQRLYTLHALNHIYKTRTKVIKDTYRLAAEQDSGLELRDQGFTRAKVLVLLPTRNACYEFINTLLQLSGLEQSENKKRFKNAFYSEGDIPPNKPEDFVRFFSGNNDDVFCLGVKFTRRAVKLYSSFYSSDLIVASPLGLKMIIGSEGDKKRDYDFLSSVEVVIVDQADAMQMQSWDNVNHIFKYMNLTPTEMRDCDFSRLREWYINRQAQYLRQTIVLSQFVTPEINALFSHRCLNIGGKVKFRPRYKGAMARVGMKIRQTFSKLTGPAVEDPTLDPDARFKYLSTIVLPSLQRGNPEGTLIFIPSYLDFTRIRNYMDKENFSFSAVSEYSTASQLGRARTYFRNGTSKYLLYTERLHYFRRFDIRGARTIIFFGVPENPRFYEEVTRFLGRTVVEDQVDISMVHVRAIYSQWDALKLERIVGSERVGVMYKGTGETYEFQ
ncbi:hypothetical protein D0Z00_000952 [Geotrichum galactomycetum]|uniref:Uncharacterized protein n=1 Tax=Geotrichum galactomycetum TaxID=27317 RepID=A0ACB6V8H3_9ASCO|nr:hypothetical protein D0Z00_000952 [Geotrichum candidum]